MKLPCKDHPIWKVIPSLLATIVLITMLTFNYANGYDMTRDTTTVIATVISYLVGQGAKQAAGRRPARKR